MPSVRYSVVYKNHMQQFDSIFTFVAIVVLPLEFITLSFYVQILLQDTGSLFKNNGESLSC